MLQASDLFTGAVFVNTLRKFVCSHVRKYSMSC